MITVVYVYPDNSMAFENVEFSENEADLETIAQSEKALGAIFIFTIDPYAQTGKVIRNAYRSNTISIREIKGNLNDANTRAAMRMIKREENRALGSPTKDQIRKTNSPLEGPGLFF